MGPFSYSSQTSSQTSFLIWAVAGVIALMVVYWVSNRLIEAYLVRHRGKHGVPINKAVYLSSDVGAFVGLITQDKLKSQLTYGKDDHATGYLLQSWKSKYPWVLKTVQSQYHNGVKETVYHLASWLQP